MANPNRPAIVVVEDNVGDIFLVQQVIAAHGLDADLYIMADGEEAMTFFSQVNATGIDCPDVLLLDLNIPRIDGFDVLSNLRASDQCRDMPVIVMTSSAARADKERSASLTVNAYFNKPSSYEDFLLLGDIIKKLLL